MEIEHAGVTLHVAVDGPADAPPVLVMHGITSSTVTWDWLVPELAGEYRLLRLDFRGHGRSGRVAEGYRSSGYVADAVAVCEQVAGRPVLVLGHSLGGATAAGLAQRHPELVRAMVLEDPPLARPGERVGGSLLGVFAQMRESVPRLQESGIPHETLVQVLAGSPGSDGRPMGQSLHADALEAMATSLLQLDASVLDPVLQQTIEFVFDPDAPIPVPTLVLAADPASPDCVARTPDLERLARVSPSSTSRVMAASSHLVHDEVAQRPALLAAVREFFAAHR